MPVTSIGEYKFEPLDKRENFHGNILIYINWEKHLMFCAPVCVPLSPDMPFGALVSELLPNVYSAHPEFEKIDWDAVEWTLDHKPISPEPDQTLEDLGAHHKSLFRFTTPGLNGIGGVAS
ncbi:MAG: phenol hydroxylase [Kordiimonas sp.]|nr:phenol hydroxylase [Kordiimonas sp.]